MKTLKILTVSFMAVFLLVILSPSFASGSGIGFSLKLYGGLNYIRGGDFNEGLKGMNDFYEKYFWYYGLTKTGGSYNPVHMGMNFGGDFIIQIKPAIGIGFGAEYLQGTSESAITFTPVTAEIKTTPKASAIPLRIGMYFTLPAGSVVNIKIHAGLGYYMAKISYGYRLSVAGDWNQFDVEADAAGIGFHGGLGFELKLSRNVSLFLEGRGRYASIGGFEGSVKSTSSSGGHDTENGKLYYYKLDGGPLGIFPVVIVHDTKPSGSSVSDVRDANIDFSGIGAVAGIIIHF